LDPFDLRCSICKQPVASDKAYAVVELPDGEHGIVCAHHNGVISHLVPRIKEQIFMGTTIKHSAWAFREQLSVEEALEIIRLENEER
jgi:hypothetical protein